MAEKKIEPEKKAVAFADLPEDMQRYIRGREDKHELWVKNTRCFNEVCRDVYLLKNAAKPETIKDDFFRDLLLNILGRIGANLDNLECIFDEWRYPLEYTAAPKQEKKENLGDDFPF